MHFFAMNVTSSDIPTSSRSIFIWLSALEGIRPTHRPLGSLRPFVRWLLLHVKATENEVANGLTSLTLSVQLSLVPIRKAEKRRSVGAFSVRQFISTFASHVFRSLFFSSPALREPCVAKAFCSHSRGKVVGKRIPFFSPAERSEKGSVGKFLNF